MYIGNTANELRNSPSRGSRGAKASEARVVLWACDLQVTRALRAKEAGCTNGLNEADLLLLAAGTFVFRVCSMAGFAGATG